jgi:nucleoid-associated protein YgaU
MNTFSLSAWILQSITLFIALLAAIPIFRAIIGLALVAISETFSLQNPRIKNVGIKLIPTFLRASLGLGLAIGVGAPAMADYQETNAVASIPVIDRVNTFEEFEVEPTVGETKPVFSEQPVVDETVITSSSNTYTIRSGDSLWSIAQSQIVGKDASVEEIDKAWREIWRANRDVIGENPSLIRPGQKILLNVKVN